MLVTECKGPNAPSVTHFTRSAAKAAGSHPAAYYARSGSSRARLRPGYSPRTMICRFPAVIWPVYTSELHSFAVAPSTSTMLLCHSRYCILVLKSRLGEGFSPIFWNESDLAPGFRIP